MVALGIDVDVEVRERLRGPEQRADLQPFREHRRRAEEEPGEEGRAERRAEDPELRLLELAAVEGERRDEQRDGKADAGDRPAAGDGHPADRRPDTPAAHARNEPRGAEDPDGLAEDVAEQDPERDRRAEGAREEAGVDRDARVRKREQRHDQVARPRVVELLEPLVRGDREPQPPAGRARELRRRLLAELPEPLRGKLEVRARGRVRVREQAHREPDHDRLDARLEQRDPDGGTEQRVDEADADAEVAHDEGRHEDRQRGGEPRDPEALRVHGRDHEERDDVVDDRDRDHEGAQAIGEPRADQGEQSERERGVGRHRDAPAMGGRATGVEREVDRDGDRHAADRSEQRQGEPPPLPQLPEVELPSRLQPDDEEEEGHQAAVHPVAKVERDAPATDPDRERRAPQGVVR